MTHRAAPRPSAGACAECARRGRATTSTARSWPTKTSQDARVSTWRNVVNEMSRHQVDLGQSVVKRLEGRRFVLARRVVCVGHPSPFVLKTPGFLGFFAH
jgi:hypothetical protein